MPKSKRQRVKPLTQTSKKGADLKAAVVETIRKAVDSHNAIYAFSFENMRTNHFKIVRKDFLDSRFFLGKNKVMKVALGRTKEEEYQDNLFKLSGDVTGNVGLLFTNKETKEVEKYFNDLCVADFARSGAIATETVVLPAGALPQFVGSMIESLRSLGLPVDLKKGVIHLNQEHTVCTKGSPLTPEQAKILVHFEKKMSDFKIKLCSRWTKDGSYESFVQEEN